MTTQDQPGLNYNLKLDLFDKDPSYNISNSHNYDLKLDYNKPSSIPSDFIIQRDFSFPKEVIDPDLNPKEVTHAPHLPFAPNKNKLNNILPPIRAKPNIPKWSSLMKTFTPVVIINHQHMDELGDEIESESKLEEISNDDLPEEENVKVNGSGNSSPTSESIIEKPIIKDHTNGILPAFDNIVEKKPVELPVKSEENKIDQELASILEHPKKKERRRRRGDRDRKRKKKQIPKDSEAYQQRNVPKSFIKHIILYHKKIFSKKAEDYDQTKFDEICAYFKTIELNFHRSSQHTTIMNEFKKKKKENGYLTDLLENFIGDEIAKMQNGKFRGSITKNNKGNYLKYYENYKKSLSQN